MSSLRAALRNSSYASPDASLKKPTTLIPFAAKSVEAFAIPSASVISVVGLPALRVTHCTISSVSRPFETVSWSTVPSTNHLNEGKPLMLNAVASSASSVASTTTIATSGIVSLSWSAAAANFGRSMLQCPHHGAINSTSANLYFLSSASKLSVSRNITADSSISAPSSSSISCICALRSAWSSWALHPAAATMSRSARSAARIVVFIGVSDPERGRRVGGRSEVRM
mmetsp:Transcript_40393/g.95099  ORF Transcript_40393/g.95099 Transcript_40393/m.95099 type:complete len:227 (+) Transcript_40393:1128-1808(+)